MPALTLFHQYDRLFYGEALNKLFLLLTKNKSDKGDADASFKLGEYYRLGTNSIEPDVGLARRYYETAKAQGHTGAASALESLAIFSNKYRTAAMMNFANRNEGAVLTEFRLQGYTGALEIPVKTGFGDVVAIAKGAFIKSSISKLILPKSLKVIEDSAFSDCTNLTEIVFNEGLERIELNAFRGCTALKSVSLKAGLTSLDAGAFSGCSQLKSVSFERCKIIPEHAFNGCTALSNVTFSQDLQIIEENAFSYCLSLQSIAFPKSLLKIGAMAFEGCSELLSVGFNDGLWQIGQNAFSGCASIKSLTLPSTLRIIGKWAFSSLKNLSELIIRDGVEELPEMCFNNSGKLREVILPASARKFSAAVFKNCRSIQRYSAADKSRFFTDVSGVLYTIDLKTLVAVPPAYQEDAIEVIDGCENIGDSAFENCRGISSVRLPDSLITIGESTFCLCMGLKDLNIPANVTKIGDRAFAGCKNLRIKGNNDYISGYCIQNGIKLITY